MHSIAELREQASVLALDYKINWDLLDVDQDKMDELEMILQLAEMQTPALLLVHEAMLEAEGRLAITELEAEEVESSILCAFIFEDVRVRLDSIKGLSGPARPKAAGS